MRQSLLSMLACALAGLAICSVIAIEATARFQDTAAEEQVSNATPAAPEPQVAPAEAKTEPLGPEKVRLIEPTPSPSYSKLDRKFTWEEVEAILDKLRGERAKRPQAQDDLSSWYALLSRPVYTESPGYPEHIAKLEEWRRSMPKSPTPLVVLGRAHVQWAWQARGSGFVDRVTEEGWKGFAERLQQAAKLLGEAIELGVQDGEAHTHLIQIAMGSGVPKEKTEAILDAGIKLDPNYMPLYNAMTIALLPRWGGEPGDIVAFAKRMLGRLKGDDGPDVYGHIAYTIHSYDPSLLYFGGFDLATIIKAGDIWQERYPQARNLPYFAALATMAAGDREAAKRMRPRLAEAAAPRLPSWAILAPHFQAWCEEEKQPPYLLAHHWLPRFSPFRFTGKSNEIWFSVASDSQAFALLDLKEGRVNGSLTGPGIGMKYMDYDGRRQWLMASFDKAFQGWALWAMNRPDKPRIFPTKSPCQGVAINPKLPQLAWMEGKTLHTIELAQLKEGPTIEMPEAPTDIQFSADGKHLAALGEGVSVWDVGSGQKAYDLPSARTIPKPSIGGEEFLEFDDEGRIWAVVVVFGSSPPRRDLVRFAADGKSWDTVAQDVFMGGTRKPHAAALSADRSLLAFAETSESPDKPEKIRVWDIWGGKQLVQFEGHASRIGMTAFSADSKQLASISANGSAVRLWDVAAARK